jgi:hypothetical protein
MAISSFAFNPLRQVRMASSALSTSSNLRSGKPSGTLQELRCPHSTNLHTHWHTGNATHANSIRLNQEQPDELIQHFCGNEESSPNIARFGHFVRQHHLFWNHQLDRLGRRSRIPSAILQSDTRRWNLFATVLRRRSESRKPSVRISAMSCPYPQWIELQHLPPIADLFERTADGDVVFGPGDTLRVESREEHRQLPPSIEQGMLDDSRSQASRD